MAFLSHACARAYACVILLINNYNILYNNKNLYIIIFYNSRKNIITG